MPELIADRRRRLRAARLYLVCGAHDEAWLHGVLAAGVDVVQLRDKQASDAELLHAAPAFRRACDRTGALFVLNDRPDLVQATGADGVHLGQDDMAPAEAREITGPDRLLGLSTHTAAQLDAAADADYAAVGPVHETPTKPGRPAAGLAPLRHAAARAQLPWFAIGGLHAENLGPVLEAGARRVVVVRAIERAADPPGAARALRAALQRAGAEVPVGTA